MEDKIAVSLHHQYRNELDQANETRQRLYKRLESLDGFGDDCVCDCASCHDFGDELLCLGCGGRRLN